MSNTIFVMPSGRTVTPSTFDADTQIVVKCEHGGAYPENFGIYAIITVTDPASVPALGATTIIRHRTRKSDLGTYRRVDMPTHLKRIRFWTQGQPSTAPRTTQATPAATPVTLPRLLIAGTTASIQSQL